MIKFDSDPKNFFAFFKLKSCSSQLFPSRWSSNVHLLNFSVYIATGKLNGDFMSRKSHPGLLQSIQQHLSYQRLLSSYENPPQTSQGLTRTVLTISSFTAIHLMHCCHNPPLMGHKLQHTEGEHQQVKSNNMASHFKLFLLFIYNRNFIKTGRHREK